MCRPLSSLPRLAGLFRRLLFAALLAALAAPGAALASTASIDGGVLQVRGTSARDNLEVRYVDASGPAIGVKDLFGPVAAGPGCAADSDGTALCAYNSTNSVQIDLGDGDDDLLADVGLPLRATGGAGDDRMFMRTGISPWPTAPATLDGGDGNDRLGGGAGDDNLLGGAGVDGIDGSDGNDRIDPGPGEDSVTDSSGDDRVFARDGDVDHVDCGPGTDTGDFDPDDVAQRCELGNLPTRPPDCTPEIDSVSSMSYAALRRARALTVRATAERGCTLRARISLGSGVVLAAATGSAQHGSVRIRLSSADLRRIHRKRRFAVWIQASAPGTATVHRSFAVRVR